MSTAPQVTTATAVWATIGDFTVAKRTVYGAFSTGNATGGAYRIIVKAGQYEESAFTRNGKIEPIEPVMIIGWGGVVHCRTGPVSVNWSNAGAICSAPVSSVKGLFRTDVLTAEGCYDKLPKAAGLAVCQAATVGSWFPDGGTVHVNIGHSPSSDGIALIRSFHGARLISHSADLYLEKN